MKIMSYRVKRHPSLKLRLFAWHIFRLEDDLEKQVEKELKVLLDEIVAEINSSEKEAKPPLQIKPSVASR